MNISRVHGSNQSKQSNKKKSINWILKLETLLYKKHTFVVSNIYV